MTVESSKHRMPQLPPIAPPSIFTPRPLRVWLVIGLFVVYLIVCYCIFFETIAPVADFPVQPVIAADPAAYWDASGVRTINVADQKYEPNAEGNLLGPVIEAKIFRTDFNVAVFNTFLFIFCLSLLRSMPEFDRATFLLLMMMNPFLLASLISLNKEIFALAGVVVFVRYTYANRFRMWWLALALVLSLFARWQQVLVILLYVAYESKFSPLRGRRRMGIAVTVLGFTIAYGLIYRLVPVFFAALLAQAEAGHTILILDTIQAYFGFPLVVIPKIMMNCMGHFVAPGYFLNIYFTEDFTNWRDQIFMQMHTFFLSALLVGMLCGHKLRLKHPPVYLLALYLLMTAVNPMVQPRYEYAAYVLLCLEASRYFRLGSDGEAARPVSQDNALAPSLG
jgi:hypothetical protein